MKNPERFDRAIKALLKGYVNDTLLHGSCRSCAVGNIVAEAIGVKVLDPRSRNTYWSELFLTSNDGVQNFYSEPENDLMKENYQKGVENCKVTGYTPKELAKVEFAFETASKTDNIYESIMACVDVLCDIEGINNPELYKELFTVTN